MDTLIAPAATKEDVQTINNVNFQWTGLDLSTDNPKMENHTPGSILQAVESVIYRNSTR